MADKAQLFALVVIVLIGRTLQMFNGDYPESSQTEGQS